MQQQTVSAVYNPGMMTFGGGYYSAAPGPTYSGNKITAVARFNIASFSGGLTKYIGGIAGDSGGGQRRIWILVFPNDHGTADFRSKVRVLSQDTSGTVVFSMMSIDAVADGSDKFLFVGYDGDAGAATFEIDGVDADDSGSALRTLTTGTLATTASNVSVGAIDSGGGNLWSGDIGYFGYHDTYGLTPSDFYDSGVKELDESGWTEWGSQPIYWNQFGTMDDNKGSAGNMTEVGTITGPS